MTIEEVNALVRDIQPDERGRVSLHEYLLFYRDITVPHINFYMDYFRTKFQDVDVLARGGGGAGRTEYSVRPVAAAGRGGAQPGAGALLIESGAGTYSTLPPSSLPPIEGA